jgi:hypothetical protein
MRNPTDPTKKEPGAGAQRVRVAAIRRQRPGLWAAPARAEGGVATRGCIQRITAGADVNGYGQAPSEFAESSHRLRGNGPVEPHVLRRHACSGSRSVRGPLGARGVAGVLGTLTPPRPVEWGPPPSSRPGQLRNGPLCAPVHYSEGDSSDRTNTRTFVSAWGVAQSSSLLRPTPASGTRTGPSRHPVPLGWGSGFCSRHQESSTFERSVRSSCRTAFCISRITDLWSVSCS